MDPLFVATPVPAEIEEALAMWPELDGTRLRPLLISAFGDIFVERSSGDVWVVSPIDLSCDRVAGSVDEFERYTSTREWADERLLTEVALLARDQGVRRSPDQVFAVAPHPRLTGSVVGGMPVPMSLRMWHHLALQIREQTAPTVDQ